MNGHGDLFGLLAELAIALAGFAGVAAAFAGRERAYRPTERIRLVSLFLNSGVVIAGCGGVQVLLLAGASQATSYRIVCLCAGLFIAASSLPLLIKAYRAAAEPDSTSEPWALYLSTVQVAVVISLFGANAVLGEVTLIVGAFWIELVYGVWMFSRILTRPN